MILNIFHFYCCFTFYFEPCPHKHAEEWSSETLNIGVFLTLQEAPRQHFQHRKYPEQQISVRSIDSSISSLFFFEILQKAIVEKLQRFVNKSQITNPDVFRKVYKPWQDIQASLQDIQRQTCYAFCVCLLTIKRKSANKLSWAINSRGRPGKSGQKKESQVKRGSSQHSRILWNWQLVTRSGHHIIDKEVVENLCYNVNSVILQTKSLGAN